MAVVALSHEERALIESVSPEALMASTRTIAGWARLSGTPDEAAAFDWIEDQLRRIGLGTARYAHPGLVSWPESASLTVVGDAGPQDVPCATHGFAAPTPAGGLEGDLVYAGRGSEDDLRRAGVRGKIALIEGIAAPNRNLLVESAGAMGSVWIAGTRLHERILSPVWGTPTPETAGLLPRTPSVSVTASAGRAVKALAQRGPVRTRMVTSVYRGWKQLPCLIGTISPLTPGPEADTFVMLSGHVDSWYHGAMDNGTANAAMLEVARLLAEHRSALRRGLRLAFWSGHSHARYAGSAWYADTFWLDLHDHCVAHVNIDSVGARGAAVLSEGNSMAELRSFASEVIEQIAGQRLSARRYGRAGDQSFWGHGIPSLLMSLSEQPVENADPVLLALHQQISGGVGRSGGLGSWWHTPEDTVDKIDPANLARDASIYALLLFRLCALQLLPLDYAAVVGDLLAVVRDLETQSGGRAELAPLAEQLASLEDALGSLGAQSTALRKGGLDDARACRINRCLVGLGRLLIPVDYTRAGMFDHDLAVPTHPLPGLHPAADLGRLTPRTDEYEFLRTRVVRERNRAVFAVREARRVVEETLRANERG